MKAGDLVKQKKTLFDGPSPVMLVMDISRDSQSAYVLFHGRFFLLNKERLEVINENR